MLKPELVLDAKAELGEGPCWDNRKNVLYWVDIEGQKVCIYDPAKKENKEIKLNQQVSAIVPLKDEEGAVVVTENGFYHLDIEQETLLSITNPEEQLTNNRFNDGKCDANGRFWAGTMNKEDQAEQGALYCLEADGTVTKKIEAVSTSNGLAWSGDNQYFYHIDTPTQQVSRFYFDIETAQLSERTTIIDFSEEEGYPDGMTIDEEGKLWIAHWGGSRISKWDPDTGKKVQEVRIPAMHVTSCAFGGEDGKELYITTAKTGLTEEELAKYPLSGGLFKLMTDVRGGDTYYFNMEWNKK